MRPKFRVHSRTLAQASVPAYGMCVIGAIARVTDREDYFHLLIQRAGAPLLGDVYVGLDLSGPAAAAVRFIRAQYSYDYLGAMPVEITVAGSGGVGSPRHRGDPRSLFAALDEIVESTARYADDSTRLSDFQVLTSFMPGPRTQSRSSQSMSGSQSPA